MKKKLYPIFAILVLIAVSLACGSSNTGVQVGTASPAPVAAPQIQIYHVGDVIQVETHTIVLNSAEINGDLLKANLTIENKGSSEITVSSMLSFTAKAEDGTKLEQDIFDCGSSSLDGSILAGDKLRGDICWKGLTTNTVKIYYAASLFGSGAIVWEISR